MINSLFSNEVNREQSKKYITVLVIIAAVAIIFGVSFVFSNNSIPMEPMKQVNAEERPPQMRYEVTYKSRTFILFDHMVDNPNMPQGTIEERAIEIVKKKYGDSLPDGFENDIRITTVINAY